MRKKIACVVILILLKVLMLMTTLLLFRATLAAQKVYAHQTKVMTRYIKRHQNMHYYFGSKRSYP